MRKVAELSLPDEDFAAYLRRIRAETLRRYFPRGIHGLVYTRQDALQPATSRLRSPRYPMSVQELQEDVLEAQAVPK